MNKHYHYNNISDVPAEWREVFNKMDQENNPLDHESVEGHVFMTGSGEYHVCVRSE